MALTEPHKGISLNYEIYGEGPPLLLISGTGHNLEFWSNQLPYFAKRYSSIVFDNRGVGRSTIPTKNYTLADMADDAVNLLDHINVNCAHVMGFSMGGHIAQELAINYPDRVKSLGIHHSWSKNSPTLKKFQETRLHLAKNDQRIALTELSMLALHSSRYYDSNPKEMEAHRSFLLNQSPVNNGWVGQLEACINGDTFDRLNLIDTPTLITCSNLDIIAPPHLSQQIQENIKGSRLHIMEGTGHVSLMESPKIFAHICLEFLSSH